MLPEWNSGNRTSVEHIKQAWWDLENSKATPTNTLDNLKQQIAVSLSTNQIPLVSINFGFGYVDSLALQDGRIRIENDQLIDAGGASPYISKKVHIAVLATKDVVAGKTYQLVAGSTFLLQNLPDEPVTGYAVQNLTNGQIYTVAANGTSSVTFVFAGKNALKITVNTTKGSYTTHQDINVLPPASQTRSTSATSSEPEDRLLTSTIPFKGYNEVTATISHADYHIYYHFKNSDDSQSERILKKPIVILDGFDPLDKRNYAAIYDTLLLYGNKMWKLGDELRLKGYDVVILNFPMTGSTDVEKRRNGDIYIPLINGQRRDGGSDYIERNAYLLVKLIQDLNAELRRNGSTEKLVVVGPSMGGLISRYALAYMEKMSINHNTRL
ncbi:MAG: hypothetical protein Q4G63_07485 [Bacteroidia bacterium]|nr:hypothetical protein [Bacteroidia bacterium]